MLYVWVAKFDVMKNFKKFLVFGWPELGVLEPRSAKASLRFQSSDAAAVWTRCACKLQLADVASVNQIKPLEFLQIGYIYLCYYI